MAKVTVDITRVSIKSVASALQKWAETRDKEMNDVIRKYTVLIEAGAKKRAPVDTGFLRRNIRKEFGDREGFVVANAEYSEFQEYGTGQAGAASKVATPSTYEYGSSKGIPAQPFMFPAFEEQRKPFVREIKRVMRKV